MRTVSTYGELFEVVREQIASDFGADQLVAICPYGSLFRSRRDGDALEGTVLGGVHAKTIDVIAIVRDMKVAVERLGHTLRWDDDARAMAHALAAGRPTRKGATWQERGVSLGLAAIRSTFGELILRSAFPSRHLTAVAQPTPLYGYLHLAQPLQLRFGDSSSRVAVERYKLGAIGLDAFLGPDFRTRWQHEPSGYFGGVVELERALQPSSSAYVQLRFLGQNPHRCLRFTAPGEAPLLHAKLHGLSSCAAYAALLLIATDQYPLPEPHRVGVQRWGFRLPGARAFAWDEIGQFARGASFLAEVAVKMKILRKHESVFGADGIYAREIMAADADATMFLDGVNAFLRDYPEALALHCAGGRVTARRSVCAAERRQCLVVLPESPSRTLAAAARDLWRRTLAGLNATFTRTNVELHHTARLLRRPALPRREGNVVETRGALRVIGIELMKGWQRVFRADAKQSSPNSRLAQPWPVDPGDHQAVAAIAEAWRNWLSLRTAASGAAG